MIDFASRRERECNDLRATVSNLKAQAAITEKEKAKLNEALENAAAQNEELNATWEGVLLAYCSR